MCWAKERRNPDRIVGSCNDAYQTAAAQAKEHTVSARDDREYLARIQSHELPNNTQSRELKQPVELAV